MGKDNQISIAFFDSKPYDVESFEEANREFGFALKFFPHHLTHETAALAAGFPAVSAFVNDTLNEPVIRRLKDSGVRLVAMRCSGYNNVDLKAAFGNIHVVRVPAYSPEAVAEHAVALMLTLNRKTHKAYFRTRDGNFSIQGLLGFNLHGKTAGVIGTGRIGKALIAILRGFGMKVLAFDASPDLSFAQLHSFQYVTLDQIYRESDIISLHCPLMRETEFMINKDAIAKMKRGVMLINTSRGKLVKTQDLIDALKKGQVGSAGLDVYEEESEYFFEDFSASMISDDVLARLLSFPNVLVTAHQGFFTKEALKNIATTTLGNVAEFFERGIAVNEICYRCGTETCQRKQGKPCF